MFSLCIRFCLCVTEGGCLAVQRALACGQKTLIFSCLQRKDGSEFVLKSCYPLVCEGLYNWISPGLMAQCCRHAEFRRITACSLLKKGGQEETRVEVCIFFRAIAAVVEQKVYSRTLQRFICPTNVSPKLNKLPFRAVRCGYVWMRVEFRWLLWLQQITDDFCCDEIAYNVQQLLNALINLSCHYGSCWFEQNRHILFKVQCLQNRHKGPSLGHKSSVCLSQSQYTIVFSFTTSV